VSNKLRLSVVINLVFLMVFCLVILASGGGVQFQNASEGLSNDEVQTSLLVSGRLPTGTPNVSSSNPQDEFVQTSRRIIIKSAILTIEVKEPTPKLDEITAWTEASGGWIVSSTTLGTEDNITISLKIRVPAERFQEAVTLIKSDVEKTTREQITGDDVTDQYTDLQSQLANLKVAESQLQTLMTNAQNTTEVLAVYDKLINIRGQIETIQGRLNFYSESAAYSSIDVTINQYHEPLPEEKEKTEKEEGWSPSRTINQALDALVASLQFGGDLGIWLIFFVLPILVVCGLFLLIARLVWRWWQKRKPLPTSNP
jgi:hypothetical protein